jgi:hypothetical protein
MIQCLTPKLGCLDEYLEVFYNLGLPGKVVDYRRPDVIFKLLFSWCQRLLTGI